MAVHSESGTSAHQRLRRIEGRHNALVKNLRQAFSNSEATPDGFCAIEGMRIVEEAIRSGLRFGAVFFSESAVQKAERLLPQIGAHAETLLLPDKLFEGAVPSESPQGVAALVRLKTYSLDDILERAQVGPILVFAGLQDPGNLGTALRSAEALGSAGVILGQGTVSGLNSKVIRASAGSVFRLPIVAVRAPGDMEAVSTQLRQQHVRLLATSSHKGTTVYQTDLTPPTAIFIGSEGAGLPRRLAAGMDETVAIPHNPQVESLNAGVAASILLYEAARQRSGAPKVEA